MLVAVVDFGVTQIGLGDWWRLQIYPTFDPLARLLLSYWWLALLVACWLIAWPLVILNYFMTNVLVRLLGYDVRPFPGGWIDRLLRRIASRLVKARIRRSRQRGASR